MGEVEKKVAVIAGGTGYVGSAIAKKLADDGFAVAVLSRNPSPDTPYHAYQCDLADEGAVAKTFAQIQEELGPLYTGVFAAGEMPKMRPLHQLITADFEDEVAKALVPAFNFLTMCAQILKTYGDGALVGITTANVVTLKGTKARGAYSAVKFGQQGLLVALREELQKNNVRVYSVAPGVMAGGLNKGTPQAFLDIVAAQTPGNKLTTAEDVADVVAKLVADAAGVCDFTTLIAPETGNAI